MHIFFHNVPAYRPDFKSQHLANLSWCLIVNSARLYHRFSNAAAVDILTVVNKFQSNLAGAKSGPPEPSWPAMGGDKNGFFESGHMNAASVARAMAVI